MIEIMILEFVSDRLDVSVHMEYPSNPERSFVVLRKEDSDREDMLDTAMFVADSYGPSLYEAARLNEAVKAALDGLTVLPRISAARLINDYPAYDEKNRRYRYQAVYDITHY